MNRSRTWPQSCQSLFGGPLGAVAEQLLELAEGQFDRIEIGRVRAAGSGLRRRPASMASATRRDLWLDRLSMTTTSPARRAFAKCCWTQASKTLAVDRAFDAQRGHEAGRTHRAQEGRRLPPCARDLGPQPAPRSLRP